MPFFRDIYMLLKPLYNLHSREDHEDEHCNGKNKGNYCLHIIIARKMLEQSLTLLYFEEGVLPVLNHYCLK